MNYLQPTPIQADAIPPALLGKDILGTAQTGTGKTAAFGIPLLSKLSANNNMDALILAPTRELAAQIHQMLTEFSYGQNIFGALVVGGESFTRQRSEIQRGVDYVVATPGRLNDHLTGGTISLSRMGFLVLDEVDRMLDMGFLPQIKAIMKFVPQRRQTLMFSATLPKEIETLANALLRHPVRIAVDTILAPAAQISETTLNTTHHGKGALVLEELKTRQGRVLIFARTKSRTERLAKLIHTQGHAVVCLHGGRTQAARKQALERFRKGTHRVMVATDLAGRGIDVTDIEHVINYDVPATREDYIHRIGRTARFGKTGNAVNFLVAGDFDGEKVLSGKPSAPRVVYRSPRRRRR